MANQFHGNEQKIDDAKANQSMTGPTRSLGQGATTDMKSKSWLGGERKCMEENRWQWWEDARAQKKATESTQ